MESNAPPRVQPWMRGFLLLAGMYNIGWGIFIYVFPDSFYQWITQSALPAPWYITWQGLGVLLFGMVYWLVASYPRRFWWMLALGIASKAVGAVGFYFIVMEQMTKQYVFHLLMNDLLWLIPFTVILISILRVRRSHRQRV